MGRQVVEEREVMEGGAVEDGRIREVIRADGVAREVVEQGREVSWHSRKQS